MMTSDAALLYSAYAAVVFAAAVGLVLGLGALTALERKFDRYIVPTLIPLIVLGIAGGALLSGRRVEYAALDLDLVGTGSGAGSWLSRIVSALVVGLALAVLFGRLVRREHFKATRGQSLIWAYVLFFIGNNVLNAAFGTEPSFVHSSYYPLLVFAAVHARRDEGVESFVLAVKYSLLVLAAGSLVAAVVLPSVAVQPGYNGWIPGLSIRLWGLGSNPNSVGPLALVLFLIEICYPSKFKWLGWLTLAIALAVLVLAQSKTAWASLIVGAFVLVVHRLLVRNDGRLPMGWFVAASFGLAAVLLVVMSGVLDSRIDRFISSRAGGDATTLSGRNLVWQAAIGEWRNSPIVGYGPELWNAAYRSRIGLRFAVSAHNQFLQSLSGAGLVGLSSLLIYLVALGWQSLKAAGTTRGLSVALFVLIVLRCITETPLVQTNLLVGDVVVHLLLFGLVARSLTIGMRASPASADSAHAMSHRHGMAIRQVT